MAHVQGHVACGVLRRHGASGFRPTLTVTPLGLERDSWSSQAQRGGPTLRRRPRCRCLLRKLGHQAPTCSFEGMRILLLAISYYAMPFIEDE